VKKTTLFIAIFALLGSMGTASEPVPVGLSRPAELASPVVVPRVTAPGPDRRALAVEDSIREAEGLPYRFALAHPVSIRPDYAGLWETLGDGTSVWRIRIASEGASHLNFGFTDFRLPEGAFVHVYGADGATRIRSFGASDNAEHGELWTPVLLADDAVIELDVPKGLEDGVRLNLGSINVGYRGFGSDSGVEPDSGSCNVDVVCPLGNGWRDEIPSVARISIGGTSLCTGFMVNNTSGDQRSLFMTAYHCGLRSSNAASLVAYWNYETSTCGGTPDGSLAQNQSGSTHLAGYSPSDFTLVELTQSPDPAWEVTFAGWDRSGSDTSGATAIHHPRGDEKRISFEYDPTTTTSYLGTSSPGDGTHVRVADWDEGTTEGCSSGSPLFDPSHRAIGQLHGGYAACGNDLADWYGKISVSWNGGGTSSTRLRDHLDPGNTGAMLVDTLNPHAGCSSNADCDDGIFCNGAETCSANQCVAGADPCPGQGCDETADQCVPLGCDNDGLCEAGEDCNTCPSDCISGFGATCGNSVCETGAGEDCLSCPDDCVGTQGGKPANRFCCGDGDGINPVGCGDARCNTGPLSCSSGGGASYCCGDGLCEGLEDASTCSLDCDGSGGGTCLPAGASCTFAAECCSVSCKGPSGRKTCK
jgi:hypothetical protein